MADHINPRETLDREIKKQLDAVLVLGSMVEQATIDAVDALKNRDFKASRKLYAADQVINEKRYEIEQAVIILIATQQPMARDVRLLAGILEIITELERMGDYAKGIGRINLMIGEQELLKPLVDIPAMAETCTSMLHRALGAFAAGDVETAYAIPHEDDRVDELHNRIQKALLEIMVKDPSTVDQANNLMWAAHNLERFADRVTNVCERTIYIATGEIGDLDISDNEFGDRGL